jgi:hypothetical protein
MHGFWLIFGCVECCFCGDAHKENTRWGGTGPSWALELFGDQGPAQGGETSGGARYGASDPGGRGGWSWCARNASGTGAIQVRFKRPERFDHRVSATSCPMSPFDSTE